MNNEFCRADNLTPPDQRRKRKNNENSFNNQPSKSPRLLSAQDISVASDIDTGVLDPESPILITNALEPNHSTGDASSILNSMQSGGISGNECRTLIVSRSPLKSITNTGLASINNIDQHCQDLNEIF